MSLSDNIREYRKRLNMTQGELGALCGGYSAAGVWKWETGKSEPTIDALCALADIFGITLDELVDHTPRQSPLIIKPETTKKEPRVSGSGLTVNLPIHPEATDADFEKLLRLCVEKVLREKGIL